MATAFRTTKRMTDFVCNNCSYECDWVNEQYLCQTCLNAYNSGVLATRSNIRWQSTLTREMVDHLPWDVWSSLEDELNEAVAELCAKYGVSGDDYGDETIQILEIKE
jgi:hypothetical protein